MFSSSKQQKPSLSVSSSSSSSSVVVTFDLPNSLLSESISEMYKDDELFESTKNLDYDDHDDHDEHDDTHYPLKLSSDHNNNTTLYGSFIGLRERTTSQTSVEGRDRTMSQNSVEQLESQQQKSTSSLLSNVSTNNTYNYRRLFGRSYNNTTTNSSKTLINNRKYISNTPTTSNVTSISSSLQQQQQQYQWLRITIQYIQSIRVPIWLLRQCYGKQQQFYNPISKEENATTTTTTESSNNSSITGSDIQQQQQDVYFISGLDRVFFHKESCCADDIRIMNWKPPRYIWYMISGAICDIIQLCILYILHLYIYDSSLCWMIAFCSSILFRHTCHRYFVFGNYIGGYTKSLIRMYAGYSVTIVLSTILNFILNHIFIVNIFILALLTMAWTGIVNYFILKYFWNIGNHNNKKSTTTTSSSSTTGNINLQKSDTANKQLQQLKSSPPSHTTTTNAVSFAIKS